MARDTHRLGRVGVSARYFEDRDVARGLEAVAEADELGYGAIWVPEGTGREVFTHCSLLLAAAPRIVVGSAVAGIGARAPWATQAAANTLAIAHPGRFVLGLGVGHPSIAGDIGVDYTSPLRSIGTYLDRLDSAPFNATPPSERPPRLLAALGPAMTELALRRCEGVLPNLVTADQVHELRARDDHATIAVLLRVIVETDPAKARAAAKAMFATYFNLPNYVRHFRRSGWSDDDFAGGGSDRLIDALVAWGDVDAVAGRVEEMLAAGADHVSLQIQPSDDDTLPVTQWRELAPAVCG